MKSRSSEIEDVKDEGPEEGEVLPEKGALSSLVEDEVDLWTTDVADEQVDQIDEKMGARGNGPQRKQAKKATYRKKRAEKERQLGVRPSKRIKLSEPQRKSCIFFIKGRCAKGKDCTFSHDCTPVTKSEPCKFLTMGCCLKGEDCPFSHELASFPCKYFHTRGYCYDGENCRFSHEAISDEDYKRLLKRMDQDSRDRQDRAADGQHGAHGTNGPYLPPGYELVHSPDKTCAVEEAPSGLNQQSGLEACLVGGKKCEAGSQHPQEEGPSCDDASHHQLVSPMENLVGAPGKSPEGCTLQEKKLDCDGSTQAVDQKEGKNFVLLAARKAAAAAAAAAAAGQSSGSDPRALSKSVANAAFRRSRGFEGGAMDLLKVTLEKDRHDPSQVKNMVPGGSNTPGRGKYVSAMALLEGILKDEQ